MKKSTLLIWGVNLTYEHKVFGKLLATDLNLVAIFGLYLTRMSKELDVLFYVAFPDFFLFFRPFCFAFSRQTYPSCTSIPIIACRITCNIFIWYRKDRRNNISLTNLSVIHMLKPIEATNLICSNQISY